MLSFLKFGRSPQDPDDDGPISLSSVLDENFACLLRVAYSICHTLRRPKDRAVCRKTLAELEKFHRSDSIEVKQNVRKFLRFYLKALHWTQTNQPVKVYEKWYGAESYNGIYEHQNLLEKTTEKHIWLEEGSSFLAMKHFEDGSSMIYSAVSKDPSAGWVKGGLKQLTEDFNSTPCCGPSK